MKRIVFLGLILTVVLLLGCTFNDPVDENYYTTGSLYRQTSGGEGGYWHEYNLPAIDLSPGSSGATQLAPNVSSLGGYRFDAISEYLYYASHIENDWDGIGDGITQIWFEVNIDNTGGADTDTVKFQLECWHKVEGELGCTVQSLDGNTVVGKSDQHELFIQEITVPNIRTDESISFRLNLNTIQSEVTSVIVNYIEFKYPTYYPAMEVN